MPFLVRHPDAPAGAIHSVDAELDRTADGAIATFHVSGDIGKLVLSPPAERRHTDDLWRTTCFELFVEHGDGGYREYNFAPSGAWAAYDFDGYRSGMRPFAVEVSIEITNKGNNFTMVATIQSQFPDFAHVGMSAVIEETDGHLSYWASSFPPGKPDFHSAAVRSLILDGVSAE